MADRDMKIFLHSVVVFTDAMLVPLRGIAPRTILVAVVVAQAFLVTILSSSIMVGTIKEF